MENSYAVSSGVWKIEQDTKTLGIVLLKYGAEVEKWKGERLYTWEELHDILLRESYKRRGEK